MLDDVTVSALVEREIEGQSVPEPIGIRAADKKTYRQIHAELQGASRKSDEPLGTSAWPSATVSWG